MKDKVAIIYDIIIFGSIYFRFTMKNVALIALMIGSILLSCNQPSQEQVYDTTYIEDYRIGEPIPPDSTAPDDPEPEPEVWVFCCEFWVLEPEPHIGRCWALYPYPCDECQERCDKNPLP